MQRDPVEDTPRGDRRSGIQEEDTPSLDALV